ncbi:O-antigen ligase family protein [Vibrio diabolicus]|uniref:O-antigen ligase family protein n=1 Tax=Vibrio diabolicus TaxID=50719 RepID=UPI002160E23C|nr:O-antigen ligase family protein [Vibrio diabolicus]MCR9497721.1 O-antigen ligase family protein [Vibrio alginolyticus]MCS0417683.1 O-antigen ligase family protein [Vibrio diabolicus]
MNLLLCHFFFFTLFFRGLLPPKIFEIVIVITFLMGFFETIINRKSRVDLQNIMLILFLLVIATSQVYFTKHLTLLTGHVSYLIQGILIFYSFRYICRVSGVEVTVRALIFWGALVSFIGSIFYILNILSSSSIFDIVIYQKAGMARLTGFQTNPNYFALTICVIPILCMVMPKIKLKKTTIFVILVAIIFSGSRGGILAALIPLVAYVYLKSEHKIAYGFVIILLFFSIIFAINADLFPALSRFDVSSSNFSSGRTEHWIRAIDIFKENYFFGVGNNSFLLYENENGSPIQVHNNYLRLLAEGGVIYFTSWFLFLILLSVRNNFKIEYYFIIMPLLIFSLVNDPYISKEFWLYLSVAIIISSSLKEIYKDRNLS